MKSIHAHVYFAKKKHIQISLGKKGPRLDNPGWSEALSCLRCCWSLGLPETPKPWRCAADDVPPRDLLGPKFLVGPGLVGADLWAKCGFLTLEKDHIRICWMNIWDFWWFIQHEKNEWSSNYPSWMIHPTTHLGWFLNILVNYHDSRDGYFCIVSWVVHPFLMRLHFLGHESQQSSSPDPDFTGKN